MTSLQFSSDALDRSRAWLAAHGRPLERVRLAQVLGTATPGQVAEAVSAYANSDGGVGNALESDCRAPESSALGALTALDILRAHRVPGDRPLVGQVCRWLVESVESDRQGRLVWPFLPPSAQASPHAPWWDQSEPGQLAETFAGYAANPGVALTAHLWRREVAAPGSVPAEMLAQLTQQVRDVAADGVSAEEVNAHDALAHFAGEAATPADAREAVTAYLRRVLPERVMATEADYATYGIHPLWIAPTPAHPLAAALADTLPMALDRTIASQQPDGSWATFWDWGGWHPDVWPQAEQEWRGSLIVRNIAALLAHGRVVRP
ncbi:hypothetical protein [Nostocoides australiense]